MCHFGLPGQFGQDGSISSLCMGWLQPHAGGECGAKYYATKEPLCGHKGSLCSFLSANSVNCTGWNKTELGVCVDTCACVCLSPASTSVCQSKALFNAVDSNRGVLDVGWHCTSGFSLISAVCYGKHHYYIRIFVLFSRKKIKCPQNKIHLFEKQHFLSNKICFKTKYLESS